MWIAQRISFSLGILPCLTGGFDAFDGPSSLFRVAIRRKSSTARNFNTALKLITAPGVSNRDLGSRFRVYLRPGQLPGCDPAHGDKAHLRHN